MSTVKKPCVGCVYYGECGNTNRTMPCDGRETKTEREKLLRDGFREQARRAFYED